MTPLELPGPLVDSGWLVANRDAVHLVDVRWYIDGRSGRAAYDAGHLPGAVFADLDVDLSAPPSPDAGRHPLPRPDDFAMAMGRLGIADGTPVVTYDDAGGAIAARLWWMLTVLGEPAAVLDGGIGSWAGRLVTDPVTPEPAVFTSRPWPEPAVADADRTAATAGAGGLVFDARSADRYAGVPNDIDPRFGHVPGARSAPFADNFVEGTQRLRSAEELDARFRELGISEAGDVVVYCGSGVTACHDILATQVAGLPMPRLYVGSWSQWGADESRAVETGDGA